MIRISVLILFFALFFIVGCGEVEDEPTVIPSSIPLPGNGSTPDVDEPEDLTAEDPPAEDPPVDGILEKGSRVKVTNVVFQGEDKGLNIREDAGIESPIIGSAKKGATGTIIRGPGCCDGWIWWEILWDDNGKAVFEEDQECCFGWSAETNLDGNIRYLTEIN